MLLLAILSLIACVLVYFVYLVFFSFKLSPLSKLPTVKPSSWWSGSWNDISHPKSEWNSLMLKWIDQYGDMFAVKHLFNQGCVVIANPVAVKRMLLDNVDNYHIPNALAKVYKVTIGEGLLTLHGDAHTWNRKIVQPAFSYRNINEMVPTFCERAEALCNVWRQSMVDGVVKKNMSHEFPRYTFDVLGLVAFSHNFNTIVSDDDKFADHFKLMTEFFDLDPGYALIPGYAALPLPNNIRRQEGQRAITEKLSAIIAEKKAKRQKEIEEQQAQQQADESSVTNSDDSSSSSDEGNEIDYNLTKLKKQHKDLLDLLIEANESESDGQKRCSDEQLIGHIQTFAFAGHETTSLNLVWTLYAMGKHPEVTRKMKEEVDEVLGDKKDITFTDIEKMTYIHNVVKESLRLYDPTPILGRVPQQDDELCGHTIPAGTLCVIVPGAMNRHPSNWDDPLEFIPERWNEKKAANYMYMPFGAGSRTCIGQRLANLEVRTCLAKLLQHFTFEIDPEWSAQQLKEVLTLTLKMTPPGPVMYIREREDILLDISSSTPTPISSN